MRFPKSGGKISHADVGSQVEYEMSRTVIRRHRIACQRDQDRLTRSITEFDGVRDELRHAQQDYTGAVALVNLLRNRLQLVECSLAENGERLRVMEAGGSASEQLHAIEGEIETETKALDDRKSRLSLLESNVKQTQEEVRALQRQAAGMSVDIAGLERRQRRGDRKIERLQEWLLEAGGEEVFQELVASSPPSPQADEADEALELLEATNRERRRRVAAAHLAAAQAQPAALSSRRLSGGLGARTQPIKALNVAEDAPDSDAQSMRENEIEEAKAHFARSSEQLTLLRGRLRDVDHSIADILATTQKNENSRAELRELREKVQDLRLGVEDFKRRTSLISEMGRNIQAMHGQVERLSDELSHRQRSVSSRRRQNEEARRELDGSERELQMASRELLDLEKRLSSANAEFAPIPRILSESFVA